MEREIALHFRRRHLDIRKMGKTWLAKAGGIPHVVDDNFLPFTRYIVLLVAYLPQPSATRER